MDKKAVALLSGGLDSILAIRLMLEQEVEIEALNFLTVFCTCTRKGCQNAAKTAAETLKVPLKIVNISEEYLQIVKSPKHGYGSNMNPCIDCRIFIFKKAKEYMEKVGASFIITGEVLGERPMSQRKDAILLIEKEAGLKGLILRPLSAKFFEPTIPENQGLINRNRLLDISGRSRKPQIALAEGFGINDYPCPAGGCLLTDSGFARRIKDLIEHDSLDLSNVRLLKTGRHFRLTENAKLIIGREDSENAVLEAQIEDGDICLRLSDYPSPFSIIRGDADNGLIELAASVVAYHTKFRGQETLRIDYRKVPILNHTTISIRPAKLEEVEKIRI
ncbi:MAG: hypothetical protein A2987_03540 [Omnitrophica bacterium RIFCSPLOWO2_01_FULL_45_10]|nr:MAG: hypothetical protein A2987_03540 [Omnitrophica bacterium RIFCSPLOWO2_01_FULL_45_10]